MGINSKIGWCDATQNFWRGCTPVSEGCANCYAARRARRFKEDFGTIIRSKTTFRDPLKWKEPKRIFVGSLSDFFHEDVPAEWRREAWEIMYHARGNGHTFMILTKRPENIVDMLPVGWMEGQNQHWPYIWFGVTAENQEMADLRIPQLLRIPAAKRFVSAEPLLGPIRWNADWLVISPEDSAGQIHTTYTPGIHQVIVGGESGPRFRIMEEGWATDLRDDCIALGISFFFKQWAGIYPKEHPLGMMLEGKYWKEVPE